MTRILTTLLTLLGIACSSIPLARAADPNILWIIVHDRCRTSAQHVPCLEYHRNAGYALLKDIVGKTQLLLLPTARITGLEDPQILSPAAPTYLQFAWDATRIVQALAQTALPPEDLSLAINSLHGRTQNQLHVHIDCLKPAVTAQIHAHLADIRDHWAPFPARIGAAPYQAMRIPTLQQPGGTPFQLLARAVPDMSRATLAVVSIINPTGEPEFVLLGSSYDPLIPGSGVAEELQDHTCVLATQIR